MKENIQYDPGTVFYSSTCNPMMKFGMVYLVKWGKTWSWIYSPLPIWCRPLSPTDRVLPPLLPHNTRGDWHPSLSDSSSVAFFSLQAAVTWLVHQSWLFPGPSIRQALHISRWWNHYEYYPNVGCDATRLDQEFTFKLYKEKCVDIARFCKMVFLSRRTFGPALNLTRIWSSFYLSESLMSNFLIDIASRYPHALRYTPVSSATTILFSSTCTSFHSWLTICLVCPFLLRVMDFLLTNFHTGRART